MARNNPGAYLSAGNRLSRMLANQPDPNNGTTLGGLASVLTRGLQGYIAGKDTHDQQAAQQALVSGMTPGKAPADGVGPVQAGGYQGAIDSLSGLQGNPYAGRLATDLLVKKAELDRANDLAATQRAQHLEDISSNRDFLTQQGQTKREFEAGQNALKLKTAAEIAKNKTAAAGKFYAVQTGQGTMLVDKGTGMAVMMGIGQDGSPVQIGQPFMPTLTQGGQPTAIPQQSADVQQSGAQPQDAQGIQQPSQQPQAKPLLAPTIDPQAQANKTTAIESAKIQVAKQAAFPKVRESMSTLNRQWRLVDSTIDNAIDEVSPWTAGAGSWLSVIPGTPAANLKNDLMSIKANIGFDRLQRMREESPTGGALGQVSDTENKLLQAVNGSLETDQSPAQLKEHLLQVKQFLADVREQKQAAFQHDYAGMLQSGPIVSQAPQQAQPSVDMTQPGPPPPMPMPQTQAAPITRVIGGKTYVNHNGQWYEQ